MNLKGAFQEKKKMVLSVSKFKEIVATPEKTVSADVSVLSVKC